METYGSIKKNIWTLSSAWRTIGALFEAIAACWASGEVCAKEKRTSLLQPAHGFYLLLHLSERPRWFILRDTGNNDRALQPHAVVIYLAYILFYLAHPFELHKLFAVCRQLCKIFIPAAALRDIALACHRAIVLLWSGQFRKAVDIAKYCVTEFS